MLTISGLAIAAEVCRMKRTIFLLLMLSLLQACSNDAQEQKPEQETHVSNATPSNETGNKTGSILNNILLEEKGGLTVSSAFLADEAGRLVNPNNTVTAGKPVYLMLVIKEGWVVKNNLVSPGTEQTITTHNGEPVLKSSDLFAASPQIKAEDASRLQLKVVLKTSRPDIRYYVIRFRVWDKNGKGEITGQYQLQVEK